MATPFFSDAVMYVRQTPFHTPFRFRFLLLLLHPSNQNRWIKSRPQPALKLPPLLPLPRSRCRHWAFLPLQLAFAGPALAFGFRCGGGGVFFDGVNFEKMVDDDEEHGEAAEKDGEGVEVVVGDHCCVLYRVGERGVGGGWWIFG